MLIVVFVGNQQVFHDRRGKARSGKYGYNNVMCVLLPASSASLKFPEFVAGDALQISC